MIRFYSLALSRMTSSEEVLKAENARLVAEMASMKKKIMAALKKQQADLQAKVHAAEQRALAAETAAALAISNKAVEPNINQDCVPDANGSIQEQIGATSSGGTLALVDSRQSSLTKTSSHDDRVDTEDDMSASRTDLLSEIERLKSDLEEERRGKKKQEDAALVEKEKLLLEIRNLKETVDVHAEQEVQMKEKYESELSKLEKDAADQMELLKKANKDLEKELLRAARQIAEASALIISNQEEKEHALKEAHEASHVHANLLKEHERACEELEQVKAALLHAQMEDGKKEKMEVAEETGMSEQKDNVILESLLTERAVLAEQLHERTIAFSELQKHAEDLEGRLSSIESYSNDNLKVRDDKSFATIISELQVQNEFLMAQLQEIQQANKVENSNNEVPHDKADHSSEKDSAGKFGDQRNQLDQSSIPQPMTEDLVKQLQISLVHAEGRAEHLTLELTEVQRKMDEEIKMRDEKYAELDVKFGKLQKRAKQRIQELQKEKDEVDAQLAAATEKASQASSQCSSLQHDLERVRTQAGDALRSLDAERQQLRNSNSKHIELIDDLHRILKAKEQDEKEAQRIASEKDQMVHELTDKLMEMEEKHGAVVADLMAKHQKVVEDLEGQLADAVRERTKAAETISSLQMKLAEKESQIAELDAASSGEAVRFSATLEVVRGELTRVEQEHRKEKEVWDATVGTLKVKLEESEKSHLEQERAAAKKRSQMESELQRERQALSQAQAELVMAREEADRLAREFSAYKVRAYSLVQKKEAELSAARDTELLAKQESDLKEAQRVAASTAAERDRALKALQDACVDYESQLAARSGALLDAEQKIQELATKLEATKARVILEAEAWQSRIDEINAAWNEKYDYLKRDIEVSSSELLKNEITSLKDSYAQLKGEHEAFQDMANRLVESKDQEIAHLLAELRDMEKMVTNRPKAASEGAVKTGIEQGDNSVGSIEIAEQQILVLARQQAQREEELAQCQRHIQALQDEIVELEHENRLHTQQESVLKEELRNSERSKKREGVDMTYLKNVILKLLETGEVEALLPVIAMLLQFSPEELRKCQEAYYTAPEASVAVVDAAASAPRTLLSRFMFSKAGR